MVEFNVTLKDFQPGDAYVSRWSEGLVLPPRERYCMLGIAAYRCEQHGARIMQDLHSDGDESIDKTAMIARWKVNRDARVHQRSCDFTFRVVAI